MEAKRKAQPSSTAERVLWWLPIPRPSVSLLLKHSKWNKVSGHVMWNLYWSFSSPAHTISRGKFYWNCCQRRNQKPKNIHSTKVRIWHSYQCPWEHEEGTQEWGWFPGTPESLGCFSSCATCLKAAKALALQMIPLPLTTSGSWKQTTVVPQCPWGLVPETAEDNKIHRWSSLLYKIA